MAGDELSDDGDEGAATPKPYEYSEASTLCLDIESGFGGLTSPFEGVLERSDEGHFGRRSIVAETISEEWEPSGGLEAQPSQLLEIPGALSQGSIVNEQLWGPGRPNATSRSKHVETDSVPRSACQESAGELREVGVRVAVETPNENTSLRKRSWKENSWSSTRSRPASVDPGCSTSKGSPRPKRSKLLVPS